MDSLYGQRCRPMNRGLAYSLQLLPGAFRVPSKVALALTLLFAVTGRHLTRAKVAERKTPACRSGNRSWRPRRARFIVLLVTTATARAVHSRATLHHFAAAAHTQQVAAVADGPARRAALRPSRRTQWRIQDFCKGGAAAGAFGVPQAPSCPLSLRPLRKFRGS